MPRLVLDNSRERDGVVLGVSEAPRGDVDAGRASGVAVDGPAKMLYTPTGVSS
jgi:hypothetical protein